MRISSICGSTFFSDESVQSTTTSGFVDLMVFFGVGRHLDAERAADARDFAEIPSHFRGIDVHRADDLEPAPIGDLFDDRGANRPEAEMQDLDRSFPCCHL